MVASKLALLNETFFTKLKVVLQFNSKEVPKSIYIAREIFAYLIKLR